MRVHQAVSLTPAHLFLLGDDLKEQNSCSFRVTGEGQGWRERGRAPASRMPPHRPDLSPWSRESLPFGMGLRSRHGTGEHL